MILLGETAPRGGRPGINKTVPPVRFLRELYCLDASYRPFRGRRARARRCPDTADEHGTFTVDHPGLFGASGWAHHPYSLDNRPTWRHPSGNSVPLGSIDLLVGAWDRARLAWDDFGQGDIWITEYGYQTAPDPYIGIPLVRQAPLDELGRVHRLRQPAHRVDGPVPPERRRPRHQVRRGGLPPLAHLAVGAGDPHRPRKPAFEEYPFPIHVSATDVPAGQTVQVFGIARPLVDGAPLIARIRIIRDDGSVETLTSQSVTNPKGYLDIAVDPGGSGELYILWVDPVSGGSATTRTVPITVR